MVSSQAPVPYSQQAREILSVGNTRIASFSLEQIENIDHATVASFGDEWLKFKDFSEEEIKQIGDEYFDILGPEIINANSVVLDAGCGTGRWTRYLASKVGFVEAVDPSKAVISAAQLLKDQPNVRVTQAAIDNLPFPPASFDFAMSVGVLHHIPDTAKAMATLARYVKPGGYLYVYLYYALDNRPAWFRAIFHLSNSIRWLVSKMPRPLKHFTCDVLAMFLYMPFVLLAWLLKKTLPGSSVYHAVPLSYYVGKSWKVIRNDALDRFGTPLEQRFTRQQIADMMHQAGLENVIFSPRSPFWHAVARKKA